MIKRNGKLQKRQITFKKMAFAGWPWIISHLLVSPVIEYTTIKIISNHLHIHNLSLFLFGVTQNHLDYQHLKK